MIRMFFTAKNEGIPSVVKLMPGGLMNKINLLLVFLIFSITSLQATERQLVIDKSHTEIGFKVKHLMISNVKGNFNDFTGTANVDETTGKVSAISITIQAKSIDTNDADRDKHLKNADFFDVSNFPLMTFVSDGTKFSPGKNTTLKGKLTIRNITKEISLKITFNGSTVDPWGNIRYVFSGEGLINRKDFGMNWNKTLDKGGVMVSDDIVITIESEFIGK